MNRKLISFVAAGAVTIASPLSVAFGQSAKAPASQAARLAGPTVAASTAGIRPSTSVKSAASAPQARDERNIGAGQNVALMVVGGAALVIGAVIGGTAGVLLAVGGAVVGLYGLYNFVQ